MKKTLLILAVLAVVGVVVWHFVRQRRNNASDTNSGAGTGGSGSSAGTDDFPLRFGSRGDNVRRLQTHLNGLIANANEVFHGVSAPRVFLIVDGIWGPLTDAEVRRFFSVSEVSQQLFTSNNM